MSEETYRDEDKARESRRRHIAAGRGVSLIAFDGDRGLYVFDVDPGGDKGGGMNHALPPIRKAGEALAATP